MSKISLIRSLIIFLRRKFLFRSKENKKSLEEKINFLRAIFVSLYFRVDLLSLCIFLLCKFRVLDWRNYR